MDFSFFDQPLYEDGVGGVFRSGAATMFPEDGVLVTIRGSHHDQRQAYVARLNQQRAQEGLPPLTEEEGLAVMDKSVDLVVYAETVFIRAEPPKLDLVFKTDDLLLSHCSKLRVRFELFGSDKVLDGIKQRGEWWRIATTPQSNEKMKEMVRDARASISGKPIYLYSRTTGTRWVTLEKFSQLGLLDDEGLRKHLLEIQKYSQQRNARRKPEVAFFLANGDLREPFEQADFANSDSEALRGQFRELCEKFRAAVHPQFRTDDPNSKEWLVRVCDVLCPLRDDVVPLDQKLRLAPEFLRTILWLPGGRIQDGRLVFDSVYGENSDASNLASNPPEVVRLGNERAREIIFNFVRDYDDLTEINVGQVVESLSKANRKEWGHRELYVVVLKREGQDKEIIKMVRLQKYDVGYYLDRNHALDAAMILAEDYEEYTKDRYYGCLRMGFKLDGPLGRGKIRSTYFGRNKTYHKMKLWIPFVLRDYVHGMASNRIPDRSFKDPRFALRFAELMGSAAAPNLIVGRGAAELDVYFDDGDEVVIQDDEGLPVDIMVTHHTGSFWHYRSPLVAFAEAYARPVNSRWSLVPEPERFAQVYLDALISSFEMRQREYRENRAAYESLFAFREPDPKGNFAFRWKCVLERLDTTNAEQLRHAIASHFGSGSPPPK